MIGCTGYTNIIECQQYINDVMRIKVSYVFILLLLSLLTIYFVRSKRFKMLSKKFTSLKLMFILPKYLSYLFLCTLVIIPFFLSINVELEVFLNYVYAFILPVLAWMLLIFFMTMFEFASHKLGFKSFKHLRKSMMSRK